ncbi:unnamed protein product [Caenorhabditis bovis]|uniref:Uncharacterized protein n=1 Tax=Caenorhabditis bovis TaxID=2654633 RepID=A0A8S1ETT0_9PELO|nr:unnamed protein product [Caenorhabditis bovis]
MELEKYSHKKILRNKEESDPLGIGSLVQISYSKNLSTVLDGKHVIVKVETMLVFKCLPIIKENIFVVYNSQSNLGIAIGKTEHNSEIAFHPNCSEKIRTQAFLASVDQVAEFQQRAKYIPSERVKQMVSAWVVLSPFSIDVEGSIEKIRSFVIEKEENLPEFEGYAVIKNVVRNSFAEAEYLETNESIIFNMSACQTNIMNRIRVGSIVEIRSSPSFPSSRYNWYGYDVRFHRRKNIKEILSGMINPIKLLQDNLKSQDAYSNKFEEKLKKSTKCENDSQNREFLPKKSKLNSNCVPLNTLGKGFRMSYHLEYGISRSEIDKIFKDVRDLYEIPYESPRLPQGRVEYNESLKAEIQTVLEILEYLADSDGNVMCKKPGPPFVLRDTNWKPTERRIIGLFDDFQWIISETFAKSEEELKIELEDLEEASKKPLRGGWWYRRKEPRTCETALVKEFEAVRNIRKDCMTESV